MSPTFVTKKYLIFEIEVGEMQKGNVKRICKPIRSRLELWLRKLASTKFLRFLFHKDRRRIPPVPSVFELWSGIPSFRPSGAVFLSSIHPRTRFPCLGPEATFDTFSFWRLIRFAFVRSFVRSAEISGTFSFWRFDPVSSPVQSEIPAHQFHLLSA